MSSVLNGPRCCRYLYSSQFSFFQLVDFAVDNLESILSDVANGVGGTFSYSIIDTDDFSDNPVVRFDVFTDKKWSPEVLSNSLINYGIRASFVVTTLPYHFTY